MEKDSIACLGIDSYRIDTSNSYEYIDQDTHNHIIVLHLLKDIKCKCPYCDSKNIKSHGTKKNIIKHTSLGGSQSLIHLHRHSYRCDDCNHYFLQDNPFKMTGRNTTRETEQAILDDLRDITNTYKSVAQKYNVSPSYVMDLFDKKVDIKRLPLPEVLAIDEVYIRKLTKTKYCCVLYAPQWQKIIDVIDNRHKESLIDYFARIPDEEKKRVIIVSMDLYKNYKDVVNLCLPYSAIAADSFHVIKNLNDCFNKVRINVMKNYLHLKKERSNYYWLYKKFWKFLLMDIKDSSKLIKVNRQGMLMTVTGIIDNMLSLDPELALAYELKEKYREFNFTATIQDAAEKLDDLILEFKRSKIKEYDRFITIVKHWYNEIINSFTRLNNKRISNGNLERKNSDIKTLIKVSFGNYNFPRTRNRILYSLNKNAPMLGDKKKTNYKMVGKTRGKYNKKN